VTDIQKEIAEKLFLMHPDAGCELSFATPFELLVAVILSAQCTDKRVNIVTEKLFKDYNTPDKIAAMPQSLLERYIYSCGFYASKAKHIIDAARSIVENFNGAVPEDFEALQSLAGVGRKTASVVFCVAFNKPAMPVDTHVFRVSHRLGLSTAKNPDGVERDLKAIYPPEMWNNIHHAMIFHGRYICKSQNPQCDKCLLTSLCQFK
jgi:endonuclease-3